MPRGEGGAFIAGNTTAPASRDGPQAGRPGIPPNTNGNGLSYMRSGMYALQESVRQMRGTAPAQIPGGGISVCHGVGGNLLPL